MHDPELQDARSVASTAEWGHSGGEGLVFTADRIDADGMVPLRTALSVDTVPVELSDPTAAS